MAVALPPTSQLLASLPATAKADGTISVTCDGPPAGQLFIVTVVIPTAPPGSQFTVSPLTVPAVTGKQTSPAGPVQSDGPITVTGQGFMAGAQYTVNFMGRSVLVGQIASAPVPTPTDTTSSQTEAVQVANGTGSSASPVTLNVAPSYRAFRLHVGSGGMTGVSFTGATSGTVYFSSSSLIADQYYDIPVDGSVDSQVTFQFTTGVSSKWWVSAQLADVVVNVTAPSDEPLPVLPRSRLDLLATITLAAGSKTYGSTFTPANPITYSALYLILAGNDGVLPQAALVIDNTLAGSGFAIPAFSGPYGPYTDTISPGGSTYYQAGLPVQHEVGDQLKIGTYFNSNTVNNWTLSVFGSVEPPPNPFRVDGRAYPAGSFGFAVGLGGAGTLVAGQTSPRRIMVKSLAMTAGAIAAVEGTINGTGAIALLGVPANGFAQIDVQEGILLDVGTALTGSAAGQYWGTFDIVP